MVYSNQDQGDRGSRSEQAFTLQERLSLRLANHGAEAQARLPTRLKGDGGSVRASLARKLVHAKLFGRGSGGTVGGTVGGGSAARKGVLGSISVRASQRVVVKAFVARHKGPRAVANPGKAIVQHVKYLARKGVGFDGSDAHFYGQAGELTPEAVKEATRAWGDDRHHFRLIISPEQADKSSFRQLVEGPPAFSLFFWLRRRRFAGNPRIKEASSTPVEGALVAPMITAFAPTLAARSCIDDHPNKSIHELLPWNWKPAVAPQPA